MSDAIDVRVRCIGVPAELRATGVRCFAQVVLDETLAIDGLTVRVTAQGEALVTWPQRRDGGGRHHAIVRVLDAETRITVERAVLAEAVRGGWADRTPERHGGAA